MALVPFPGQSTAPDRLPDDAPDFDTTPDDDLDAGGKMSFLEHLDELRRRLTSAVVALCVGVGAAFFYIDRIFEFIMRPLQAVLPHGGKLIYTEPTEAFVLYLQIAALAGLMISSPWIMLQLWLFIAPGLYSHEKKYAIPFVLLSTSLFLAGAAFSHFIFFPMAWQFFASFSTDYMDFMPRIEPVFSMYVKMLLMFGLVFQMPAIVFFLARMGMVTAKFLLKNTKYAILIIFIVAAVITPSADPWTQTAVALPIFGLYVLSILIAWIFAKRKQAEQIDEAD